MDTRPDITYKLQILHGRLRIDNEGVGQRLKIFEGAPPLPKGVGSLSPLNRGETCDSGQVTNRESLSARIIFAIALWFV